MDVSEERVSHRQDYRTGFKAPIVVDWFSIWNKKAVNGSWLILNAYSWCNWLPTVIVALRHLFIGNIESTAHQIKMTGENTTIKNRIKNLLRTPSIKLRRSKAGNNKESLSNKVQCTTYVKWHEACTESAVAQQCILTE